MKKTVLIPAALLSSQAGVVQAAEIILVTEAIDWDLDGLRDDHTLETFLVSEGHRVDVRPDYWKRFDPLIGTGLTSFVGTMDMGNGQLIAKPAGFEMGWIAE